MSDDGASVWSGFGADVDEVVSFGGEVHVVLDDDDGVTFVDEAVEDFGEAGDVLLMEPDGGFLNEIEVGVDRANVGDFWAAFGELSDELESMGFAAGDGGGGLSESQVAKAGFGEELEGFLEFGMGGEELGGGLDVEIKDVADGEAIVADIEGGGTVTVAHASFAVDPSGGEKIHLELDSPVAFALGALSFLVVEGESGGGVATHAGFGKLGKEGADVVEEFDVSGGAGAGGLPNG